jgi:uncharacterized protein YndB with AHSA1/START domain
VEDESEEVGVTDHVVEVTVHAAAPPEEVFALLTDAGRHVEWMGTTAVLDPGPGGEYSVRAGDGFAAAGTYLEVDPPRRAVFTWGWAHQGTAPAGQGDSVLEAELLPPGSTRVEITLEPDQSDREEPGTRVRLRHVGLPTPELVEGHRIAWQTYLDRLCIRAGGGDPGPDPHR